MGIEAAKNDLKRRNAVHEEILTAKRFELVQAFVVEFTSAPPVMCSGSFCPQSDLYGKVLQNIADITKPAHIISLSSFFGGKHGAIVFSWLSEDAPTCIPFVASFENLPDYELTATLIRIMFEYCENVHLQPSWWEYLSASQQYALRARMARTYGAGPVDMPHGIMDDDVRFPAWQVNDRRKVGFA